MKKLLAFLLIFTLTLTSFGCEKDKSSATENDFSENKNAKNSLGEIITLNVGMLGNSVKPVGVIIAEHEGFFKEEGIDINFKKVSSMNDAYMAVAKGDLDVYLFSSTAAATFISQGITNLRVFGGTNGEGSEIMAAKNLGIEINDLKDLKGLTIACQMPETGQMVLKDYLLKNGYKIGKPGEDADVFFVYVNDSSVAMQGCVKGEYDLCITNGGKGFYAEEYSLDLVGAVKDFVPVYPCCRQTTNKEVYENNQEALIKFEIANLRGYDFFLKYKEKTLDILQEYSGQKRDFLEGLIYGTDTYNTVMRVSIDPDKKACINFYKALANIGEISDAIEINWEDYVVTDVYEKALKVLMEREPENSTWKEAMDYFLKNN